MFPNNIDEQITLGHSRRIQKGGTHKVKGANRRRKQLTKTKHGSNLTNLISSSIDPDINFNK